MFGSSSSSSGMYALAYAGASIFVLGFIAFVAAIVVTVLLYKKYVSTGQPVKVPGAKRDWGPFFRFEDLWVEKILKALFIFVAALIAFESVAWMISALMLITVDAGAAFMSVIGIAILCIVLEVLNRVGFEFSMITILIWKNTNEIRKSVQGGAVIAPVQPVAAAPEAQPVAPAPVAAQPTQPVVSAQPTAPVSTGWTCSSCGHENKSGSFCAQCGKPKA